MRTIILAAAIVVLLCPLGAAAVKTGFFINGSWELKHIDGSDSRWGRRFVVSERPWSLMDVDEVGSCVNLRVRRDHVYGYNIQSRAFDGFALGAGYRVSQRWAFVIEYSYYRSKEDFYSIPWRADPDGINAGKHGTFDVESSFNLVDVSLLVEYHLPKPGLFFTFGREVRITQHDRYITWKRYRSGVLTRRTDEVDRYQAGESGGVVGIGLQRAICAGVRYQVLVSYSGPLAFGGFKVQLGFQVMPLLRLDR